MRRQPQVEQRVGVGRRAREQLRHVDGVVDVGDGDVDEAPELGVGDDTVDVGVGVGGAAQSAAQGVVEDFYKRFR